MKRVLILAALLLLIAIMIWYWTRPDPVPVTLHKIDYGDVESTVANTRIGTVKACRRAFLAPATGGIVAKLTVKEGDRVSENQVLMEIWNEDLKAQLALQMAESKAIRAKSQQACFKADGTEREADRLIRLQQHRELVSEETVDIAITEAQASRAGCHAARASMKVSESKIAAAHATVERTIVKAPFNGIVAEINAELGEFVTPSPPGIATLPAIDLLDLSCLYVSAPIDEVDAPAIHTEMKAYVILDAFPEKRFSGLVSRIAPYVLEKEKQARTVEVEVTIDLTEDLQGLLPGYSADIEVLLDSKTNVLRIPTEAVSEGNRVLLYQRDGLLINRNFKPGLSNWDFTEIQSGLKAADTIVVSIGREGVKAGVYGVPDMERKFEE